MDSAALIRRLKGRLGRLLARSAHAKRLPAPMKQHRRIVATEAAPGPSISWRTLLRTVELPVAEGDAAALFKRRFGHGPPGHGRHWVLQYVESPGAPTRVVAYCHTRPFHDVYLGGGICVDEGAYRDFPRWLYAQVHNEGGLATILVRDNVTMLGDSPALFAHVGEPRSRQASLRTGFIDTEHEHLMVFWRKPLDESERKRLVDLVASEGPF